MAEGMRRPTRPESWVAFSRRLWRAEGRTFEKVRAMSLALEEDWKKDERQFKKRGFSCAPRQHFEVRFRNGEIQIQCFSLAALTWRRMGWLAKHGFAGLKVRVEDARRE